MNSYAQNCFQMFSQMRQAGYSEADLEFVASAYELALTLFTCRFQPSGKSFIAHSVGTASILASVGASREIVAAGLLHNVYHHGDFGDGQAGVTKARRRAIRRVLGPDGENYLAAFPTIYWGSPLVRIARKDPVKLLPADRAALMMLIADHLEHLQDLDVLYYEETIARSYIENSKVAAETAANLGVSQLAMALTKAIEVTEFAEVPVKFPESRAKNAAFVIVPASCRKHYFTMLKQCLIRSSKPSLQMLGKVLRIVRRRETLKMAKRLCQVQAANAIDSLRNLKLRRNPLKPNLPEFLKLFPEKVRLKCLATGFQFTEGPVWIAEENRLLFSDIPANRIYGLTGDGSVNIFREPSGNSNGLTRDHQGRLIACEHGNRRVTRTEADGSITVLAAQFQGKRLHSPNDVVMKSDGAIYFTDPSYGINLHEQEQLVQGVYRLSADGRELALVADDLIQPNGLAFSPDEKKLYIDDSQRRHVRVFNVEDDGFLSGGAVFYDMNVTNRGAPDGMKVDVAGHVYCTGAGGVWVFDAAGNHLGTISTPEKPSNCAWGDDDWRSLYITAGHSVYRVRVNTPGIKLP